MNKPHMNKQLIKQKALRIRFILLDIDGTLTDGQLLFCNKGECCKSFNIKDGMGIYLAQKEGLQIGLISGRYSRVVEKRANELKIKHVWQGVKDKEVLFECILEKLSLQPDEIAYIGDDLNDLPLLNRVGLSGAVGDAVKEVKDVVDYIAARDGGKGAVREFIDMIRSYKGQ